MIQKYKDFIDSGCFNKVLHLDNDWLIKMPLSVDDDLHLPYNNRILDKFKIHIKFMKDNPDFFPEVKQLDKYRAAVKKLDTQKAREELYYIIQTIPIEIKDKLTLKGSSIANIFTDNSEESKLLLTTLNENDPMIKKWLNFFIKIKTILKPKLRIQSAFDAHIGNYGLEKDGTPKLIDW